MPDRSATPRGGEAPFWRALAPERWTFVQWESLCDGCGKCCLNKLEDMDTDEIVHTDVACRLLDLASCQCTNYPERQDLVPDCVKLNVDNYRTVRWLPSTCAYRLVREYRPLPAWHPLVSGNAGSVHDAGVSVRGRAVSERDVVDLEDHVVQWPE